MDKEFIEAINYVNDELHVDQSLELGKTVPFAYIYDPTSKAFWLVPREAMGEIITKYRNRCVNLKKFKHGPNRKPDETDE